MCEIVRPEGVEPPTYSSVGCRSIQLSYGRSEISKVLTYQIHLCGQVCQHFCLQVNPINVEECVMNMVD